jgi:hypothetical protein
LRLEVFDDELCSREPEERMYRDDSLEVYIDARNDGFRWSGEDDYQIVISPAPGGGLRAREFLHPERTSGAFVVTGSSVSSRGYSAVLALDRAAFGIGRGRTGFSLGARNLDVSRGADAKFNWFFHEPATILGELQIR